MAQRNVKHLLETLDGVAAVHGEEGKRALGLDHPRAGDFVALSALDRWFSYYWWLDDACAPDFARTVDIHRKPGYDPCELFIDPAIRFPKLRIGKFLLKKKLGLRGLLDVIPLDATLVRGSHGRDRVPEAELPVLIGSPRDVRSAEDVHEAILDCVRGV